MKVLPEGKKEQLLTLARRVAENFFGVSSPNQSLYPPGYMSYSSTGFSVRFFNIKWHILCLISNLLQPYRDTTSRRHQVITRLFGGLLQETEYIDPVFLRELQLIRLKKVLLASNAVPWWRERFSRSGFDPKKVNDLRDLEHFPPVNKHSFPAETPRTQFMSRKLDRGRLLLHRTSGTTGAPFEWGVDKNALFVETASYFYRALRWYGASSKRSVGGPLIAAFVYQSYSVPGIEFFWSPIEAESEERFLWILRKIRATKLRILFSYPTNLLLFVNKLSETKQRLPFDLIVTTGQRLEDTDRQHIQKYMQCPVVSLYGAREFGQMAIECPEHRHQYHVNCERILLEITDENGRNVPAGEEGLITVTSLENTVMPLIRYQLGDVGKLLPEPCSCGRTSPVLKFFGKGMDFIKLPNGKTIPFRHINLIILLEFFDVIAFYQVVQIALDQLIIRLKLKKGTPIDFEKNFLPRVRTKVGYTLMIKFEYPREWDVELGKKTRIFIPLR